jgi:hypothetical protein
MEGTKILMMIAQIALSEKGEDYGSSTVSSKISDHVVCTDDDSVG